MFIWSATRPEEGGGEGKIMLTLILPRVRWLGRLGLQAMADGTRLAHRWITRLSARQRVRTKEWRHLR